MGNSWTVSDRLAFWRRYKGKKAEPTGPDLWPDKPRTPPQGPSGISPDYPPVAHFHVTEVPVTLDRRPGSVWPGVVPGGWDGQVPWDEHVPPTPPPVVPEPAPYVPPADPEPVLCGYTGVVDGQQTKCILAPGHKYKTSGLPSPHKGTVTVLKIIPVTSP